jgi:hypothetical protein
MTQDSPAPSTVPDRLETRRASRHATFGVLLILLGLLMLADQLRIGFDPLGLRINVGQAWPVILLVLGAGRFVAARREGRTGGGYWLFFVGTVLLLHTYRVLTLSQSWPLFIIGGGVSLMFDRRDQPRES